MEDDDSTFLTMQEFRSTLWRRGEVKIWKAAIKRVKSGVNGLNAF